MVKKRQYFYQKILILNLDDSHLVNNYYFEKSHDQTIATLFKMTSKSFVQMAKIKESCQSRKRVFCLFLKTYCLKCILLFPIIVKFYSKLLTAQLQAEDKSIFRPVILVCPFNEHVKHNYFIKCMFNDYVMNLLK